VTLYYILWTFINYREGVIGSLYKHLHWLIVSLFNDTVSTSSVNVVTRLGCTLGSIGFWQDFDLILFLTSDNCTCLHE
jgi:hypothetical protein